MHLLLQDVLPRREVDVLLPLLQRLERFFVLSIEVAVVRIMDERHGDMDVPASDVDE